MRGSNVSLSNPCGSTFRMQIGQANPLFLQPFAIGHLAGKVTLQFLVWNQASLFEIDQEHFSRLQTPF